MRNYEFTVILSPEGKESELNDFFQDFIAKVQDMGGILEKQALSDPVRLGRKVARQEHGVLGVASFTLEPEKLPGAQSILDGSQLVLRSFVLNKKAKKASSITTRAFPESSRRVEQKEETPMDEKAVDQKLEEMFKEQEA